TPLACWRFDRYWFMSPASRKTAASFSKVFLSLASTCRAFLYAMTASLYCFMAKNLSPFARKPAFFACGDAPQAAKAIKSERTIMLNLRVIYISPLANLRNQVLVHAKTRRREV